ncbi:MAG TPA: ACP S-malonyltransferase [Acidimicrobiales bacterium]|nr:ACP S-malonyltransferase [Acidimicrobiales bacterium]
MLIFTFPGQGSQKPGMGRPWVEHPSWELVKDVSEAADRDVARLLLEADKDELTATRNAQLATFTLSLVVLDAIERLGISPSACAGHSLGEYSALVASGAVGFDDGVRLVAERGEAMQAAAEENPGTMAAVLGLDDDDVESACQRAESEAWVANYNAPGQVVIAGSKDGVAAAAEVAKGMGARKVMPLPVGGAFHTPLMAPARAHLRKALSEATFHEPEVPVTANVDARVHGEASEWPGLLSAQLCSPVRWRQTVASLVGEAPGVPALVEVGPGGVLTGLTRRIAAEAKAISVSAPENLNSLVEALATEGPLLSYISSHEGEHLYVSERLVISPAAGLFHLSDEGSPADGGEVAVGDLIGLVGDVEVRTPFAGNLMGILALPGERVTEGQPIAWLRNAGENAG